VEDVDVEDDEETLCASLRRQHPHGHHTRAIFCELNAAGRILGLRFLRACAIEPRLEMPQEQFYAKILREMPRPRTTTSVLCEPGQWKCTWTCHKNHFMRNFTGEMPQTKQTRGAEIVRACAVETHMDISKEPFSTRILKENAEAQMEDLIYNSYRKNPSARLGTQSQGL